MTPEKVRPYMWPHLDTGTVKLSSTDPWRDYKTAGYNHGDKIETKAGKAIFRILERDLYQDDWMKEALPIAKQIWDKYEP